MQTVILQHELQNTTETVILKLYGQPGQLGRVQPHSFTVFCLTLRPGVVDVAAMSPGRHNDVFQSKLLCSTPGPEPENKIAFS